MIPRDYTCAGCKAHGVKLWRESNTFADYITLLCADCIESREGHTVDLSDSDQTLGRVPAVPDLEGSWWGYTSVPAEGCAWWKALPLALTGEWKVKGGVERWVPYREWSDGGCKLELRRVDFGRTPPVALVFVAGGAL